MIRSARQFLIQSRVMTSIAARAVKSVIQPNSGAIPDLAPACLASASSSLSCFVVSGRLPGVWRQFGGLTSAFFSAQPLGHSYIYRVA